MAAPSIPNLNTRRRGGRGLGRANLSGSAAELMNRDAIIRSTDGDAATSRMSAVIAGYLDDPFVKYLTDDTWQKRLPLMNRGMQVSVLVLAFSDKARYVRPDKCHRQDRKGLSVLKHWQETDRVFRCRQ